MTRRTTGTRHRTPPAQRGLWGPQQSLPTDRPSGPISNDVELFVDVARTATNPGYVLIGPAQRVFRRDPHHPGHVEPVLADEAAMVAQMLDAGHLTVGGSHHVSDGHRDGPARSVLVPRATQDRITRWARLRPLPRPTGAAR